MDAENEFSTTECKFITVNYLEAVQEDMRLPRLDVCLEMVLTDLPYETRIAEIAKCGYDAVEFWFHDATFDGKGCSTDCPKDAATVKQACAANGVTLNNVVVNAPDGSFGGSPVDRRDLTKYLERLSEVIEFSKSAGCRKAITCSGNLVDSHSRGNMRANLVAALGRATEMAAMHDFVLLLEPLNTHVDHSGYFLDSSSEAGDIVREIGSPHLRLLYDVYHMQIMEGNVISNIRSNIDVIGHFHSAGVPGRNEPYLGELNYPAILRAVDDAGYKGCFGLEYSPSLADHRESLRTVKSKLTL